MSPVQYFTLNSCHSVVSYWCYPWALSSELLWGIKAAENLSLHEAGLYTAGRLCKQCANHVTYSLTLTGLTFISHPNPGCCAARLMPLALISIISGTNIKDNKHTETQVFLRNIQWGHKNTLPYLNCAAVGGAISNCPEKEKKRTCII